MSALQNGFNNLSSWKKAVVIAAPVALAGGLLYSYKYRKDQSRSDSSEDIHGISSSAAELNTIMNHLEVKSAGNKNFKNRKYERAIECYTEAIRICPKNLKNDISNCYQNRAAAYEQLNKLENVIKDCTSAISFEPKYIKAYRRRSGAYEQMNMIYEAFKDRTIQSYLEEFSVYATIERANVLLQKISESRGKEYWKTMETPKPSNLYIENYLGSFYYDPITMTTVDKGEGDVKYQSDEINEALRSKRYTDIIGIADRELASLSTGQELTVRYQYLTLVRATFLMVHHKYDEALRELNILIDYDQVDSKIASNALIKRASINLKAKHPEQCESDLKNALILFPNNADVYFNHAQMNLIMDEYALANINFKKACEMCPNFALAHSQKCYSLFRTGFINKDHQMIASSNEDFENTIKLFPKSSHCMALYGQSLMDQHKFSLADKYFKMSLKLKPNNIGVITQMAMLSIQWNSDISSALEMMNGVIDSDNNCKTTLELMGTLYLQIGDVVNSMKFLKRAIDVCTSEDEIVHMFSLFIGAETQYLLRSVIGNVRA